MKNADSQVAPRSTNESFAVVQSHRTMLERHHEGQRASDTGGTQHLFASCEKGLLNVPERKYNAQSKIVFAAIRELMTAPEEPKRRVGFHS
jgi:hypothetical protein